MKSLRSIGGFVIPPTSVRARTRKSSIGGASETVAGRTTAAAVVAAARNAGNLRAVVPGAPAPHSKLPSSGQNNGGYKTIEEFLPEAAA